MSNSEPKVFITTEPAKLPAAYQALLDPQQPIPATIRFFEEAKTWGNITYTLLLSGGLIIVGLLLIVFGIVLCFLPIVGIIFIFGAILLIRSIQTKMAIIRNQQAGIPTRYGVFITPDDLVIRADLDITVIPRGCMDAVTDGKLYYMLNGTQKFLTLPTKVMRGEPAAMLDAIQQWKQMTA